MKKIIASIALCTALAGCLVGCGGSNVSLETPIGDTTNPVDSNTSISDISESIVNSSTSNESENENSIDFDMNMVSESIDFSKLKIELNDTAIQLPVMAGTNLSKLDLDVKTDEQKILAKWSESYSTKDGKLSVNLLNNTDDTQVLSKCYITGFSSYEESSSLSINGIKNGATIEDINKAFNTNLECEKDGYTYIVLTDSNKDCEYNVIYIAMWYGKTESVGINVLKNNKVDCTILSENNS